MNVAAEVLAVVMVLLDSNDVDVSDDGNLCGGRCLINEISEVYGADDDY